MPTSGHEETDDAGGRRRFLRRLGGLGVIGLAGCLGRDGSAPADPTGTEIPTETPSPIVATTTRDTPTRSPTETATEAMPVTETEPPETSTPTQEPTPEERTPTPTEPPGPTLPSNPAALLQIDSESISTSTSTISGTLTNPYLFEVHNGEVTLEPPNDDWSIEAASGTAFDSLAAQDSQDVEWSVTIPDSAGGEYELTASITYSTTTDSAEVVATYPITVGTLGPTTLEPPLGIDCGGVLTSETVSIGDATFVPGSGFTGGLSLGGTNPISEDGRWWTSYENLTIDPVPSAEINEADTSISYTDDDSLYWTEHWGEGDLSYAFSLASGTYEVTLHFAEVVFESEGQRVFEVSIAGETVLSDFDIYAETGFATAMTESFDVSVGDGDLTISATAQDGKPKLSGIGIREA